METVYQKLTNGYFIVTALKPARELETRDEDYLAAGTVNWLSQVSFSPPQLAVSVGLYSDLNETIDHSGHFTVHVLSDRHMDLIEKFATENEVTAHSINGIDYKKENDELILPDTIAYFRCKLSNSVRCGDHTLHIGEVEKAELTENTAPLSTVALPSQYNQEIAETKPAG